MRFSCCVRCHGTHIALSRCLSLFSETHIAGMRKVNNETDKRNNLMDAVHIVVAAAEAATAELSAKVSCGCVFDVYWYFGVVVYTCIRSRYRRNDKLLGLVIHNNFFR